MDDYESDRETTPENLGDRARSAVSWEALTQFGNYGIRIGSGIVLARLLMPEDFGIVGMATLMTGLARVFRDLGLGQALVQRPELEKKHLRSTFWVTLTMGGFLCALLYLGAPFLGEYFQDERMVPVLQLLSLSFLITPLEVVPLAIVQRDLDFKSRFLASLAGNCAYAGGGISLALLGYGFWSLVWAELAKVVTAALTMCIVAGYLPPLIPSYRGIRDLLRFGGGMTGFSVMYYIRRRLDYLIVGRRLAAADLGNYQRAYRVGVFPAQLTSQLVHRVLFAALSRISETQKRVYDIFGRTLSTLALVGLSAAMLLAITVPELIPSILGEHWSGAIPSAQVLCAVAALMALFSPVSALAKALGRVYQLFWCEALLVVILIPATWLGAGYGILHVSWAVTGCLFLYWLLLVGLTGRWIGFGFRETFQALRGPVCVMLITGITAELTRLWLLKIAGDSLLLIGSVTFVTGIAVGTLASFVLPLNELETARKELQKFIPFGNS